MCYDWEVEIIDVPPSKIEELRQLVKRKARKGQTNKWLWVAADIVFIAMVILFIGVQDVLKIAPDVRLSLMNGLIAFSVAGVAFFSPLRTQSSRITMEEIDRILGRMIPGDIYRKISQTVDSKASGTQKWLAIISAGGVFVALLTRIYS